ncbi:MAG: hypothetical protein U9R13_02415 [Campylobacterota bacterium]|nr:hypothetical protein [Campylobacterota bacterium]
MDKSLLIFIAIGVGFLYFITSFVGDIQEEDDKYQNLEYQQKHMYDEYQTVDSIGREILDLTGTDAATQMAAWEKSRLKEEFLVLFPDFGEMKKFVKERTRGDALQAELLKLLDDVEGKYFSGTMNAEQAKRAIDLLK